jgi:hypothetical protein
MRALLAAVACLLIGSSAANAAGTTLEKEVEKAVRYTEELEANPMRKDAREMRQWLIQWLAETPAISVTVCDILGPIPGTKVKWGPELFLQQLFGNAAYQLKNPEKSDSISVQTAGVESLLKAYTVILAKEPGAKIPHFDKLLSKQRDGSLKSYMAPLVVKSCDDDTA